MMKLLIRWQHAWPAFCRHSRRLALTLVNADARQPDSMAAIESMPASAMSLRKHLTAAPHRPLFLIGSIQAVAAMLFWLAVLEVPALPALAWPAGAAHAWGMPDGLFAPFVFGFLFTALPNWVNGAPIRRAEYLPTAGLMAAGNLLFYAGLRLPGRGPTAGRVELMSATLLRTTIAANILPSVSPARLPIRRGKRAALRPWSTTHDPHPDRSGTPGRPR
jgi:hypothetical protein